MTPDYRPGTPLFDRCFLASIGDRPSCRLSDALEAAIPAGVKRYLLAETVALLEADLAAAPRLRRLLGGGDPVGRTRTSILLGLAPLYAFSQEEFQLLLGEGLSFTHRALVRPLESIEAGIIGVRRTITLDAVRAYFSRTADYGYFLRLSEEVFLRRGINEMDAEEFRLLISRIDDQVVQQHTAAELALLTKPIFDFFLSHNAGRGEPIPLAPVMQFLADKRMSITREYIESICRLRNLETITLDQLAGYLQDLRAGEEPAVPPEPELPPPPPAEPAPVLIPDGIAETKDAPLLPDLRTLIGERDRTRFIKHVFRRDRAYFTGVVATLNTFMTWKEAAAYLQQIYSVNRLDPFDRDVVDFTDLVHRRFAAGERE